MMVLVVVVVLVMKRVAVPLLGFTHQPKAVALPMCRTYR